jgi:hypothetical protein
MGCIQVVSKTCGVHCTFGVDKIYQYFDTGVSPVSLIFSVLIIQGSDN